MVKFQVSKTVLSYQSQATNISLSVLYEHLGFIYNLILELERIFSLLTVIRNDVKTYGQILENTLPHCTVVRWLT